MKFNDNPIADVLNMTVSEALMLFTSDASISNVLQILEDLGRGYITLKQPAPTLSGEETQRVKLTKELGRVRKTKSVYILDKPTVLGEKLENGWIDVSELEHDLQNMYSKEYDFNNLGVTGVEKDCGLLIFEYESPVDNHIVIRAALQLSFEKIRAKLFVYEDIEDDIKRGYKNPDLEDIKIVDKKILDYYGSEIFVQFEKGSRTANNVGDDWVMAVKQVAVPIENKIYIVWGSEEKFTILLNMILKIS